MMERTILYESDYSHYSEKQKERSFDKYPEIFACKASENQMLVPHGQERFYQLIRVCDAYACAFGGQVCVSVSCWTHVDVILNVKRIFFFNGERTALYRMPEAVDLVGIDPKDDGIQISMSFQCDIADRLRDPQCAWFDFKNDPSDS